MEKNEKRGDALDTLLAFERLSEGHDEFERIGEYPPQVIDMLRLFVNLWCIPEQVVPSRHIRGRYAQWIKELTDLEDIAGKNWKQVMQDTYNAFRNLQRPFIVSHPSAIRSLMIDTMAKKNRDMRDNQPIKTEAKDLPAGKADPSFAKNLKSIFEEGE